MSDKDTMPQEEFDAKFGGALAQFEDLAAPAINPLRAENDRLRAALGECAMALDCMQPVGRDVHHRDRARSVVREVMGA